MCPVGFRAVNTKLLSPCSPHAQPTQIQTLLLGIRQSPVRLFIYLFIYYFSPHTTTAKLKEMTARKRTDWRCRVNGMKMISVQMISALHQPSIHLTSPWFLHIEPSMPVSHTACPSQNSSVYLLYCLISDLTLKHLLVYSVIDRRRRRISVLH